MIMFQALEWAASFVEIMIGILLCAQILGIEKLKVKETGIVSFFWTILVWTINQYHVFSFLVTIIGVVTISCSSTLIYKIKIHDTFILATAYLILIYIVDFISISMLSVIFDEIRMARLVVRPFSIYRFIHIVLSKSIFLIVCKIIINKCIGWGPITVRKMWLGVALCAGIVAFFVKNAFSHVYVESLFLWMMFLLLILVCAYSAAQYLQYARERDWLKLAVERNTMLSHCYEQAIRDYRSRQIFYHDIKNQYVVLKNYIEAGHYDDAAGYMKKLDQNTSPGTAEAWTGIEILDVLIACKVQEARKRGISVEILSDRITMKMELQDLIALMGNAFDNAIEASAKADGASKWIRLSVRRVQQMTYIKLSNSYEEEPESNEGRLVTSKPEKELHGLGMASMKLITDKYQGNMEFSFENGVFSLVISFFC